MTGRRLVIVDDAFPWTASGFRMAEYETYLRDFGHAEVFSMGLPMRRIVPWEERMAEYAVTNPEFAARVERYDPDKFSGDELVCVIFLSVAHMIVRDLEIRGIPFIFTLYPGGGFWMDRDESDGMLRRVCGSRCFQKVIVTQKTTRDYLLSKGLVDASRIEFIYGGTFDADALRPLPKKRYKADKDTFDLCFVAQKYMHQGKDKGYDVFIEAAKVLCARHEDIRVHLVGMWSKDDVDLGDMESRVTFYGLQPTSFFPPFHAAMDLIVSPAAPHLLVQGKFDGFPTGCCVEAALCGTAVFCTDPLNDNLMFEDGKHLILISRDVPEIVDKIESFYQNPDRLYELSAAGEKRFREVFGHKAQTEPRIALLRRHLEDEVEGPRVHTRQSMDANRRRFWLGRAFYLDRERSVAEFSKAMEAMDAGDLVGARRHFSSSRRYWPFGTPVGPVAHVKVGLRLFAPWLFRVAQRLKGTS